MITFWILLDWVIQVFLGVTGIVGVFWIPVVFCIVFTKQNRIYWHKRHLWEAEQAALEVKVQNPKGDNGDKNYIDEKKSDLILVADQGVNIICEAESEKMPHLEFDPDGRSTTKSTSIPEGQSCIKSDVPMVTSSNVGTQADPVAPPAYADNSDSVLNVKYLLDNTKGINNTKC